MPKKEFIKEIKERLEKEKENIEKELQKFTQKERSHLGKRRVRFPHFDGDVGSARLEEGADEVEEYSTLLSIKEDLEKKLANIENALEKIRKGKYGICEKCGREISEEKLMACPETNLCLECQT